MQIIHISLRPSIPTLTLHDEFEPLPATTVAALKRAMRMEAGLHHVANAIEGLPDADVADGHRQMGAAFANLQLRLPDIAAKFGRALTQARDPELISYVRERDFGSAP